MSARTDLRPRPPELRLPVRMRAVANHELHLSSPSSLLQERESVPAAQDRAPAADLKTRDHYDEWIALHEGD